VGSYDAIEALRLLHAEARGKVSVETSRAAENAILAHDGAVVETPGGPIVALRKTATDYPGIVVCIGEPRDPNHIAVIVGWHAEYRKFVIRAYKQEVADGPIAYFAWENGESLPT